MLLKDLIHSYSIKTPGKYSFDGSDVLFLGWVSIMYSNSQDRLAELLFVNTAVNCYEIMVADIKPNIQSYSSITPNAYVDFYTSKGYIQSSVYSPLTDSPVVERKDRLFPMVRKLLAVK